MQSVLAGDRVNSDARVDHLLQLMAVEQFQGLHDWPRRPAETVLISLREAGRPNARASAVEVMSR